MQPNVDDAMDLSLAVSILFHFAKQYYPELFARDPFAALENIMRGIIVGGRMNSPDVQREIADNAVETMRHSKEKEKNVAAIKMKDGTEETYKVQEKIAAMQDDFDEARWLEDNGMTLDDREVN